MVEITPTKLHWIDPQQSVDPEDFCAHSPVRFSINGETVVSPEDGDWAVNVSALYLLRSLHDGFEPREEDQLFPCCGHVPALDDQGAFFNIGCSNGVNFTVTRRNDDVVVTSTDGRSWTVRTEDWRTAVISFADKVQSFYADLPKNIPDADERAAMTEFWREWQELRTRS